MHEAFDQPVETTRDIVFFGNAGMKDFARYIPAGIAEEDTLFNMKISVEETIRFLGTAETVVTSSYHGAYWATLLGKKVIGIPTSSKFYGMRHAIPICAVDDWRRYAKLAHSYPEALDDCRTASKAFADKVSDYFFG